MQYFDFSNLINKYKSEFIAILPSEGKYNDAGDWVEGKPTKVTFEGAVISFKESKIFRSEGTLTTNDKRLFMFEQLGKIIDGLKVVHDNKLYSVEDCTQNARFTGIYAYTLRYVSAFKEDDQ